MSRLEEFNHMNICSFVFLSYKTNKNICSLS